MTNGAVWPWFGLFDYLVLVLAGAAMQRNFLPGWCLYRCAGWTTMAMGATVILGAQDGTAMNGIKRAVMSGVLVAGMGLPMIAAVPAAAQSGYGRPYPGQYASDYYGNNGYYSNNGYYNNGYRSGYYDNGYRGGYYDNGYRNNSSYYYNNRYNGVGPGKGAVIGGAAGVILGGLLGGGKGALIGGAAGAGIGAAAGAANRDSHRYDSYGYRGY